MFSYTCKICWCDWLLETPLFSASPQPCSGNGPEPDGKVLVLILAPHPIDGRLFDTFCKNEPASKIDPKLTFEPENFEISPFSKGMKSKTQRNPLEFTSMFTV